jgi:hypothetical protein
MHHDDVDATAPSPDPPILPVRAAAGAALIALVLLAMTAQTPPAAGAVAPVMTPSVGSAPVDWAYGVSVAARRTGRGVEQGPDGVTVVTGDFAGTMTVAGTTLASADGSGDAFLAAFTAAGRLTWMRAIGGAGNDVGLDVEVLTDGSIVASGLFSGTANFGGGVTLTAAGGAGDAFTARFTTDGDVLWARQAGGTALDFGNEIAADTVGNVVVGIASESRSLAFPDGPVLTSAGGTDAVLAKYAPDGTLLWTRQVGGPGIDVPRGVDTDAAGNVLLAGEFTGSLPVGSATHLSAGGQDAFVVRFDPTGAVLWSRRYGGAGEDAARGVDGGPGDAVYLAGKFTGGVAFGRVPLASAGGSTDVFVTRLSAQGAVEWARSAGSADDDEGAEIDVAPDGVAVVAGSFTRTATFAGGTAGAQATSAGGFDEFLAAYDAEGTLCWLASGGGPGGDVNYDVSLGPDDTTATVGSTGGGAVFDSATLPPGRGFSVVHRTRGLA